MKPDDTFVREREAAVQQLMAALRTYIAVVGRLSISDTFKVERDPKLCDAAMPFIYDDHPTHAAAELLHHLSEAEVSHHEAMEIWRQIGR